MHPNQATHNTYRKADNSVRYCTLWKQHSASRGTISHHKWARREQRKTKQTKNHCNKEPEEKDMVLTVVSVDAFRSLVYLTYDLVQCVMEETVKISWSSAVFIGLRNVGLGVCGVCWCVCVFYFNMMEQIVTEMNMAKPVKHENVGGMGRTLCMLYCVCWCMEKMKKRHSI